MSEKITSKAVEILLERKYCAPEWSFFSQVPRETGGASQIADGIAFNLWPSRGLEVIGFEIKVNRGDWLNELKQPAKSMQIQSMCDRWYVVAPKEVVKEEEVPKTWGWLEVQKGRLVRRIEAPELKAEPVDRHFMAAIMRKVATQDVLPDELKARLSQSYKDGEARGIEQGKWKMQSLEGDLSRLKRNIEIFKTATGVDIDTYSDSGSREAKRYLAFKKMEYDGTLDHINHSVRTKLKALIEINALLENATPTNREDER